MDSGELARQKASALHQAGVARGEDPKQPYLFAKAQARHHDIDVEAARPGASILDGGRATFTAADSLIIHEDCGTEFERAFLIAHELGHALLGDGTGRSVVYTIDPARPAESAPVGNDRVTDYGRHQRREVQMDLFARELLLPRSVLKQLHLDENLSAAAIAERFQAPFPVVAQQLLDALLLPAVEPKVEAEKPAFPMNDLQRDAARFRGGPYLLEAGPGTGKTQTLTSRIEGLLDEGVDPRTILVLTFSKKAAGELSDRIARKNPPAAAAMWIGTFHAFGLDLVRRFHVELKLPQDPRLMDRADAVEFFEENFPKLRLRYHHNIKDPTRNISDLLSAVSRAKDEVVDADAYAALAKEMRDAASPENQIDIEAGDRVVEIGKFYHAYEAMKRAKSRIDYGDLVLLPVRLLEGNPAAREAISKTYKHVLVDEYQDVNRGSIRLLQALCPDGQNLWAVGDAKQSIYRFRGASSFNMAKFGVDDFTGGTRGRLGINYRSRKEIVQAFSAFAGSMKVASASPALDAHRDACGQLPELRTVTRGEQQIVAIADAVEEMRAAGHKYRDQAILCSGNERLAEIGRELEALGIPVLFLGSLFERPEVKDLLSFLLLLADKRPFALLRVGNIAAFRLTLADAVAVLEYQQEHEGEGWLERLDELPVSAEAKAALASLAGALAGFDETSRPWEVLASLLLDRTRMAATLATSTNISERSGAIAIWQFMNFVRSQPSEQGLPIRRLLDRIRRLARIGDDRELRQLPASALDLDAVKLMTIHGAKGLEFSVVHVPGLNGDTFPGNINGKSGLLPPNGMIFGATGSVLEAFRLGAEEERECLFYVAASRAKERLFLYAVTQKSNGTARPTSPYLNAFGVTLRRREVVPTRTVAPPPTSAAVELILTGPLRLSVHQIALYGSCPRRFFYTHVVRIGGHRVETSYMRMHEAVRTVVQDAVKAAEVAEVDDETIARSVTEAFKSEGLDDPEAIAALQEAAVKMVRYFHTIRSGHTAISPALLELRIGDEAVTFQPDDVLKKPSGERVVRIIKTGHKRDVKADIGAAAHQILARHGDAKVVVELVFLADGETVPLNFRADVVGRRHSKLAELLSGIRGGDFHTEESERYCPGCPAYFVCGPVPLGPLERKSEIALPVL